MSTASRIHIHKLIIHKVDHRNYDAPLLSDMESPVTDPEVLSFLRSHIVNNLVHKHTRTARFLPMEEDQTSFQAMCDRLLDDPDQFVPQTRRIAEHLFATVDKRVSPGDLVMCTFADRGEDAPTWLALLKMDPEDGFVSERVEIDGKVRVILRRVPNVLPRGELQKCAFILPREQRQTRPFDLRVLDQQIDRHGAPRLVASFFSRRFLQCDVEYAPQDRTRAYYYRSHEWLQSRDHWPRPDVQKATREVKGSLRSERVDVAAVAQEVIPEREEREQYLEYLRSHGVKDLVFQPDAQERDRLLRYTTFDGDHRLRLRIETDAIGECNCLTYKRDDEAGVTVVTIHTVLWDERP